MMLLVLARATDLVAKRFVAYVNAAGIQCVMPQQLSDIDLCITSERNGQIVVKICTGAEQLPVHGILNRGLPLSEGVTSEEQFQFAETLASWWSVLAFFPGPVINRPSRRGFLPDLERLSLIRVIPNIEITPTHIGIGQCPLLSEPRVNVHLLRNSEYIGQLNDTSYKLLNPDEVYTFTGFDPTRTLHVLQAGNHLFNLSDDSGNLSSEIEARLSGLMVQIAARSATFSLSVVQDCAGVLRLVHATSFPGLYQYQHLENRVYQSLLEYLMS